MGFRKKMKRLGKGLGKKKNWRAGLVAGGQGAELLGQGAMIAGVASGQPELVSAGGVLVGGGKLAEKTGKSDLLKSKKKGKK